MLDLAKLSAVPIEVKVGERVYRLAPLTLRHLGQLEDWARNRILADLPAKLKAIGNAKLDKAEAEKLRAQIVRDTDLASRDPLEQSRMMDSCAGQREAFAIALRACQPMEDKEIDSICTVAGLMQIRDWVQKTYPGQEKADGANPPPAQAAPTPSA